MKFKVLLVFFIILLFLNGCTRLCPSDSRLEELIRENHGLKEEVAELESQITNLKNALTVVTEERDDYLKQLDEFYLTQITGDVDLIYWDRDHIVKALEYYDEGFKNPRWEVFEYRQDLKDFYWLFNTSLGFVKDPFFELRRKNKGSELSSFHFRVERLTLDYNRSSAQKVYDLYLEDLLRETQIDHDLKCFQQTVCRDVKVIKCTKDNKDYHSWSEGSYLFTTRFDGRQALDAFERFYCHPDPYASLR